MNPNLVPGEIVCPHELAQLFPTTHFAGEIRSWNSFSVLDAFDARQLPSAAAAVKLVRGCALIGPLVLCDITPFNKGFKSARVKLTPDQKTHTDIWLLSVMLEWIQAAFSRGWNDSAVVKVFSGFGSDQL